MHSSTYCRHCTAAPAWSGRPGLDCEAVLQRVHSCAAQPQCSIKEPAVAVLIRHEVDRPAWASSASSESRSLELLQTLHALVGAAILRRTNGGSHSARARCAMRPPLSRRHAHTLRPCRRQGGGVMRRRAGPASLPPRPTIHWAAPCNVYTVKPYTWATSSDNIDIPHTRPGPGSQ